MWKRDKDPQTRRFDMLGAEDPQLLSYDVARGRGVSGENLKKVLEGQSENITLSDLYEELGTPVSFVDFYMPNGDKLTGKPVMNDYRGYETAQHIARYNFANSNIITDMGVLIFAEFLRNQGANREMMESLDTIDVLLDVDANAEALVGLHKACRYGFQVNIADYRKNPILVEAPDYGKIDVLERMYKPALVLAPNE